MGSIPVEAGPDVRVVEAAARRAYEMAIAAGATPQAALDVAAAKYRVFRPDIAEPRLSALIGRLVSTD
jgi:hypothetical protein